MYVGISYHRFHVWKRLRVCRLVCKNDKRIYPYQATDGVSDNYTKEAWILKCDLQGFFMSINRRMLQDIIKDYPDKLVINI